MEKRKIYQRFMEIVGSYHDSLVYVWRFSNFKRVTMDHSSYLKAAELFFEEYYQSHLIGMPLKDAIVILMEEFVKSVEIVEFIDKDVRK